MSNYGDDYREMQQMYFVNKWVPRDEDLGELTKSQYRYALARARAAEAELKEIKAALSALRKVLN